MLAKTAKILAKNLSQSHTTLATAESCTGGLIADTLTNIPGSSTWFTGGVIAYANTAKTGILDVSPLLLKKYGAVSAPVAMALAHGIRKRFKTSLSLATTGIAGPTGGSPAKPIGLVFIACASASETIIKKYLFKGTRVKIKNQAAAAALHTLLSLATSHSEKKLTKK